MTLKVIDVSSYQSADAVNTPGTDAVIVKVSQGTGYINPQCDSQYQEAKRQGKLLGLYHYLNGVGAKAEAKFFVDNSTGYWQNDSVTLWADWEGGDNSAWGNGAYVAEFIAEVNQLVGVACCGIYTGIDGINQSGGYLAATTPLWFAGYPDLRDSWDAPDFMYSIAPWEVMTGWQFTDSNGSLDRSIFYLDHAGWVKLSTKPNNVAPVTPVEHPKPPVSEYSTNSKTIEQMAGDVQKGLVGDGDVRIKALGKYYTAVQAILNERYNSIQAEECHNILANETLNGVFGDGDTRKFMLGNYYNVVQQIINGDNTNPKADDITYVTVDAGDTLSGIAAQFGTTVERLVSANGISNPDMIYAGQVLNF